MSAAEIDPEDLVHVAQVEADNERVARDFPEAYDRQSPVKCRVCGYRTQLESSALSCLSAVECSMCGHPEYKKVSIE